MENTISETPEEDLKKRQTRFKWVFIGVVVGILILASYFPSLVKKINSNPNQIIVTMGELCEQLKVLNISNITLGNTTYIYRGDGCYSIAPITGE